MATNRRAARSAWDWYLDALTSLHDGDFSAAEDYRGTALDFVAEALEFLRDVPAWNDDRGFADKLRQLSEDLMVELEVLEGAGPGRHDIPDHLLSGWEDLLMEGYAVAATCPINNVYY